MELIYVVNPRPDGAFGQAGCGEGPLTAPHCSIINAIDNACGVRIRSIPAYPDKVLKGLKSEKKAYDVADASQGYVCRTNSTAEKITLAGFKPLAPAAWRAIFI
jgi:aldehyde oxidoreductase